MRNFILSVLGAFGGAVHFVSSPLYRSPYRNSAEALRGDWLRMGKDIESTMQHEQDRKNTNEASQHE